MVQGECAGCGELVERGEVCVECLAIEEAIAEELARDDAEVIDRAHYERAHAVGAW